VRRSRRFCLERVEHPDGEGSWRTGYLAGGTAVSTSRPGEKKVAKTVLESLILKHEADRWVKAGDDG